MRHRSTSWVDEMSVRKGGRQQFFCSSLVSVGIFAGVCLFVAVSILQVVHDISNNVTLATERSMLSASVSLLGDLKSRRNEDKLLPLEIHADIDNYIINNLPEPNHSTLSKIYSKSSPMASSVESEDVEMPALSRPSRFVVLTFANAEYFENLLIINWMCSLRALGIENFVVIPIDEDAARAAMEMDSSILPPESIYWDPTYWTLDGSSKKKKNASFSGRLRKGFKPTEIFIEFIWRRAQLVRTLLNQYPDLNVVLSDADTTWAHRPWEVVPQYFNQSNPCDMFFTNDIEYDETDVPLQRVEPLSGFIMIRNREVIRDLYFKWVKAAIVYHTKDQPSLRAAIQTYKTKYRIGPEEYDEPKGNYPLALCTLDRERFPTIQAMETGAHAQRYHNRTNQIALYHPNFFEKKRKPQFFKSHHQWYLDESSSSKISCAASLKTE